MYLEIVAGVRVSAATSPTWVPRRSRAAARRAHRRRLLGDAVRAVGLPALVVALVALPVPPGAPVLACEDVAAATVVLVGQLADDGELTGLRERHLADGAEPCEREVTDATDVAVAILHQAADGRSLEASELTRVDGPVDTRVTVRDTTARSEDLAVTGPAGVATATRRIGVPQLVQITVRYPSGWELAPAGDDGTTVSVRDDGVEVSRAGVLFAPLFDEALQLAVTAVPGRGTPTVTVEATPLTAGAPVPAELLDRDATAVVGALLDVAADGVRELADGTRELADGTDELAGGARDLADGTDQLADGTAELRDGAQGLSGGIGQSATGAQELAGGADELARGTAELAAGVSPLAAGARQLADGAQQLADGLALPEEVAPPPIDPRELLDAVAAIEDGIRDVSDDLADLVPPGTDPTDPDDPNAPLALAVLVLQGLADATGDLAAGIAAALQALVDAAEGLAAAADGAAELAAGAQELAAGLAQLDAAVRGLRDGAGALAAGSGELAGGLSELSGASRQLADGAGELTDGTRELADGSDVLADGTRELADGTEELAAGAGELPDALQEVLEVADRGGEQVAVTSAVLDAGSRRAHERVGGAELVTTQLVHRGTQPLPLVPLALGALAALVLLGLPVWLLRRRSGAQGSPTPSGPDAAVPVPAEVSGGQR